MRNKAKHIFDFGMLIVQQRKLNILEYSQLYHQNVDISRLGEIKRSSNKVETKRFNAKGLFINDKSFSKNYKLDNVLVSALEQLPGSVAMGNTKIKDFYYIF